MMMINECKKHPQHRQQPGVCSSCLTEKLTSHLSNLSPPPDLPIVKTKIFAVSDLFSPNSNSNISNSHSSTSSSTSMSPAGHRRHASTGGSVGFIITTSTGATGSLKKSRSIAFVATTSNRGGGGGGGGGFWKKLIRSTGKGTKKVFMHSRTTRTVKTKV